MVRVEEDTSRRASRLDQGEAARRHAVLEQPLSFAEHQRKYPDAMLVDEFGGDQGLQQFAAAPNMQRRPVRCLKPADPGTAWHRRLLCDHDRTTRFLIGCRPPHAPGKTRAPANAPLVSPLSVHQFAKVRFSDQSGQQRSLRAFRLFDPARTLGNYPVAGSLRYPWLIPGSLISYLCSVPAHGGSDAIRPTTSARVCGPAWWRGSRVAACGACAKTNNADCKQLAVWPDTRCLGRRGQGVAGWPEANRLRERAQHHCRCSASPEH